MGGLKSNVRTCRYHKVTVSKHFFFVYGHISCTLARSPETVLNVTNEVLLPGANVLKYQHLWAQKVMT